MAGSSSGRLLVYIDGASSNNPGPAGIGIVLLDPEASGQRIERSRFIGYKTNNQAEYEALLYSLSEALRLSASGGRKEILVRTDSELLCRQIMGEYKVRDKKLKRLYKRALHLIEKFKRFEIELIPREENKRADALAKRAIKQTKRMSAFSGLTFAKLNHKAHKEHKEDNLWI